MKLKNYLNAVLKTENVMILCKDFCLHYHQVSKETLSLEKLLSLLDDELKEEILNAQVEQVRAEIEQVENNYYPYLKIWVGKVNSITDIYKDTLI